LSILVSIFVTIFAQSPPQFPTQFFATAVSLTNEAGVFVSKVESRVYYDAPNNRSRVDSWGQLFSVNRTEIYVGDENQYVLIRYMEDASMCVEVSAPSTIPFIFALSPQAKYTGDETIKGIVCSVWNHGVKTTFVNKATGYPVRIIIGSSKAFKRVDFASFSPGPQDDSHFVIPQLNCTHAKLPGKSEMMTREQLENYLTFKPLPSGKPINMTLVKNPKRQDINPADIIAIGEKIWQIIVDNKPSSTVNTLSNGVIPDGAGFGDMSNWQQNTWNPWEWKWTNLYGVTVVDYTWSFDWQCGGQYTGGIGQYIQNAGAFPQNIDVAWGYTVNVDGQILQPANIGTQDQPIAQITVYQTMKISTIIKTDSQSCKVNLNGDCSSALLFCDQYSS